MQPATKVKIDWRQGIDDIESWNEICAWVIEKFGLPGERFIWHPHKNYMEFDFHDPKDAEYFILRWS